MLHHFIDGTLVQEVGLGDIVVLAFDDLTEGTDGFLQGNILTYALQWLRVSLLSFF